MLEDIYEDKEEIKLHHEFRLPHQDEHKDYDDLNKLLEHIKDASIEEKHLLRTLAGIAASFDGKINKSEREALVKIFDDNNTDYMDFTETLRDFLLNNRLHQSAKFCRDELINLSLTSKPHQP